MSTSSQLYYKTFAVLISLITELVSIKLTETALKRIREQSIVSALVAIREHQDSSSSSSDGRANTQRLSPEQERRMFLAFQTMQLKNSSLEGELKRRKRCLFFYLLRSPVFDKVSMPILRFVSRMLSGIPLVRSIPESIISVVQYFNRTHFYNSASS